MTKKKENKIENRKNEAIFTNSFHWNSIILQIVIVGKKREQERMEQKSTQLSLVLANKEQRLAFSHWKTHIF